MTLPPGITPTAAGTDEPYADENKMASAALVHVAPSKLRDLMVSPEAKAIITPFVPRGVSYEEIVQEVHFAVERNPELKQCTALSLLRAIGRCAATGLVIGETVHLVPFSVNVAPRGQPKKYEKRCQRIIGYNGKIELVLRAGGARAIYAEPFYEAEPIEYEQGTDPFIKHQPIINPGGRGPLYGAYAVAKINAYDKRIRVMHITEIDDIRKQSKLCSPEKEPICPAWYAQKTLIHQITKQLPMTPKMRLVSALFDHDAAEEEEDDSEVAILERGRTP